MKIIRITQASLISLVVAWTACYIARGDSVTNYTGSEIEVIVVREGGDKIAVKMKPGATLSSGKLTDQTSRRWISLAIRGDHIDFELDTDQIAMFERKGSGGELHLHVYVDRVISSEYPK